MVNFEEISVVVSGPVIFVENNEGRFNATSLGCKSIRKRLPGAEIVFSTWENEDVSEIDYDILVRSEDVGGGSQNDGGNINRQICSRRAGIKAASRRFVLAMRSESHILRTDLLKYWGKYEDYSSDTEWCFLSHRVIIPAVMPPSRAKVFHMGDWYYFGMKEDVLDLWDINYWVPGRFNQQKNDLFYNAHRYVITEFVRKHHKLSFENREDINQTNIEICEKVIANNFVITGFEEYGIDSYKYFYEKTKRWHEDQAEINYSHYEWCQLYNRYCGGKADVKQSKKEWKIIHIILPIRRNIRNTKRFIKACIYTIKGEREKIPFYEY